MSNRNPLSPGQRFGGKDGERFEVVARVGLGGQAVVYRARDTRLGRDVAAKVSTAAGKGDRQHALERFERELQLSARVSHPHILQVYDCGELSDGSPFVILEWMANGALSDIVDRCRAANSHLPLAFVYYYATSIAAAMRAVHAKEMIHRDLKPENVLIGADGVAKLTDFGIAKDISEDAVALTQIGQTVGTPGYMAPEQLGGLPGPQSDIFSFGATVYTVLMGHRPRQRVQNAIPIGLITAEAWEEVPSAYETFLKACTHFSLDQRYETFDQVLEQLRSMAAVPDTRTIIGRSKLPPLPSGAFVTGETGPSPISVHATTAPPTAAIMGPGSSGPGSPPVVPTTLQLTGAGIDSLDALDVPDTPPKEKTAGPRLGLVVALIGLLLLAGGGAFIALSPRDVAPQEVVAAAVAYEHAFISGDPEAATKALAGLPALAAETREARLVRGVDALGRGDWAAARQAVKGLEDLPEAGGALASLIDAAGARLSEAGGYEDAIDAYARVASCGSAECAALVARSRRGLSDACAAFQGSPQACADVSLPSDPRERQFARALVLWSDGHRQDAFAAAQSALSNPLAGPPSCIESEALSALASTPESVPEGLKKPLRAAGVTAARDAGACALFEELGS